MQLVLCLPPTHTRSESAVSALHGRFPPSTCWILIPHGMSPAIRSSPRLPRSPSASQPWRKTMSCRVRARPLTLKGPGWAGWGNLFLFLSFLLLVWKVEPHDRISSLMRGAEAQSSFSFHPMGARQEGCYPQAGKRAPTQHLDLGLLSHQHCELSC